MHLSGSAEHAYHLRQGRPSPAAKKASQTAEWVGKLGAVMKQVQLWACWVTPAGGGSRTPLSLSAPPERSSKLQTCPSGLETSEYSSTL